jgi:hypothetical protein
MAAIVSKLSRLFMLNSIDGLASALVIVRWSLVGSAAVMLCLTFALTFVSNRLDFLRKAQSMQRRLSPAQRVKILLALPDEPYNIKISCIMGDGEAFDYASDFVDVFKEAGWTVDGLNQAVSTGKSLPLWISVASADEVPPAVDALAVALEAAEIPSDVKIDKSLQPAQVGLTIGHRPN